VENILLFLNDKLQAIRAINMMRLKRFVLRYNHFSICTNISQFIELVVFVLMGIGLAILVLFNFVTLRLLHAFPFIVWCFFPGVSVTVVLPIQVTFPRFVKLTQDEDMLVHRMKLTGDLFRNRFIEKRVKGFRPHRVNVGLPGYALFSFNESTKITLLYYYDIILNNTINLIVAVP